MHSRTILKNESGNVLLIVAMVMGVIVVCLLFSVDFANYFITKARLQSMTDLSAEAGASVVSEEIVKIAQIRAAEYEVPPSTDPLYYLKDSDRAHILYDSSVAAGVKRVMAESRMQNVVHNPKFKTNEFRYSYPATNPVPTCASRGLMAVVKSEATYSLPLIFPASQKIFKRNSLEVKAESISRVQLCSN